MRILMSNDDGYLAPGLTALYEAVLPLAREVIVVAPEADRSGASSSLTLDRPLMVHEASNGFFYVSGTPTDCIHLALTGFMADNPPDLIVSGINRGANMGDDTIYSGTVAAATEGHLFGIPAIAFSLCSYTKDHLPTAKKVAHDIIRWFLANKTALPHDVLLNVNVPDVEVVKGTQITRLGKRHKAEGVIPTQNPYGKTMYWIGAAGSAQDAGEGTDFHAVQNNLVSITPLTVDLTHQAQIPTLVRLHPPKF